MNEKPWNGGPAFPTNGLTAEAYHSGSAGPGMSLRDWFAGQAIVGLMPLAASGELEDKDYSPDTPGAIIVASQAYFIADAMLAERAKGEAK